MIYEFDHFGKSVMFMIIYDNCFHIIPYCKSTMPKYWIGTRSDTLEHMVGELLVILYVPPLIFSKNFSSREQLVSF